MPVEIILLTLFAALLHASWNALLRGGSDRLRSMTVMCLAVAALSLCATLFLPSPARASWGYAFLSAILHVGYNLVLVRSYRIGELGQIYPISRGSSPLLITLAAAIFTGETIDTGALTGIALISVGILSLAFRGRRPAVPGLRYALVTGCFIAAYSVTDGTGARLSGAPVSYTVWMCSLWGLFMPMVYLILRDAKSLVVPGREFMVSLFGGGVSLLAYGIVIYAMNHAPMGAVSALRETSVLFATAIGYLFLGETLTARKMLACVMIATGTAFIG